MGASSGESCRFAPARTRPRGDAVAVDHGRAFHALLAPVDRGTPGDLAASGGLGDTAVHGDVVEDQTDEAVVGVQSDLFELGEHPKRHSSRRLRIVEAEHVASAIAS